MKKTLKKIIVAGLALAMAVTSLTGCGKKSDTFTIGICQLIEHPALDAATQGFQDALKERLGDKVVFDLQNAQGEAPNCGTIVNTFVSKNVDLILANATAPLQAAAAATTQIPILGTSITDYATALDIDNWSGASGRNISGTCDLAPLDKQADIVKELFPDVTKVGLIYCSAEPNSKYQVDNMAKYLKNLGIETANYSFVDSNDISAVLNAAVADCKVLYVPTDNTAAAATSTINNIALPAGVPIVAGEAGICSGCGVATLSISYYDIGYTTGVMAYDILVNGADISKMDIQYAPNVTKQYNKDNCDALNLTIPADYEPIQ
ncbi:MAG: ABC transporter substrate-binding protein [Lachnospiraceae bacterium]|nr:ABC transporter substrate-binding protein [Lachnospiraceae bacterium]